MWMEGTEPKYMTDHSEYRLYLGAYWNNRAEGVLIGMNLFSPFLVRTM